MAEFPSDWHRQRYIDDLEHELAGAKTRIYELESLVGAQPHTLAAAHQAEKNVAAELDRVRKTKPAAAGKAED
jgi:hypothetical protein